MTGNQHGMSSKQIEVGRNLLSGLQRQFKVVAHHGDCIGSDDHFDQICVELGIHRIIHPPDRVSKRAFCQRRSPETCQVLDEKPYLDRNRDIVRAANTMYGFPRELSEPVQTRSGTWYTIRQARKTQTLCHIIYPDGRILDADSPANS